MKKLKREILDQGYLMNIAQSVTGRCWVPRAGEDRLALALSQSLGEEEIIGRLLASRGVTLETAEAFLSPSLKDALPDPSCLKEMDTAVERILNALQSNQKIAVFGDYDVDGATSSALLKRFFRDIGEDILVYIPDRIEEGYGPNTPAFQSLQQQGAQVIITVDCGTTSFAPLEEARTKGLDVIVIDHHIGEPQLPPAIAIINPNRLDEDETALTHLCAAGLTFLFVVALNRRLRQEGFYKTRPEPSLLQYLDLVALGTVCDVMPLTGLNRVYVAQGLKIMAQRKNVGLKALADAAQLSESPSAYHLGFILGPRINAGGRVGKASFGSQLLSTEDAAQAEVLAQNLHFWNEERQAVESQVLEEAKVHLADQDPDAPIAVVAGDGWHPGVIGIVASRLKERTHRPALVITWDEAGLGKGSGRSIPGIDLGTLIQAACQKGILIAGGGHKMAAGFSLKKENLTDFRAFLKTRLQEFSFAKTPELLIDGVLTPRAANTALLGFLERLAPYGVGNAAPRFAFSDLLIQSAYVVGADHVKCVFKHLDGARLNGIAFRIKDKPLGQFLLAQAEGRPVCVAGTLQTNTWMGRRTIQLMIEDAAIA